MNVDLRYMNFGDFGLDGSESGSLNNKISIATNKYQANYQAIFILNDLGIGLNELKEEIRIIDGIEFIDYINILVTILLNILINYSHLDYRILAASDAIQVRMDESYFDSYDLLDIYTSVLESGSIDSTVIDVKKQIINNLDE